MAGSVINLEKIWQEIGAWKKEEFRKAEFYQALPTPLLALALSLFDVGTDFNLAFQVPVECGSLDWNYTSGNLTETRAWVKERLNNPCAGFHHQLIQSLTFFAISLSGLLMTLRGLRNLFTYLGEGCCSFIVNKSVVQSFVAQSISFLITLAGFAGFVYLTVLLPAAKGDFPIVGFILAVVNSLFILGIKLLAVFIQGHEIRRLSALISCMESRHESAVQLYICLWISLKSGTVTTSRFLSMASSLIVIGKTGVESFLLFGEQDLLHGVGFKKQLGLFAFYCPVFIFTALFRIGSLAVGSMAIAWSDGSGRGFLFLQRLLFVLLPPFLPLLATLLVMKWSRKLEDIGTAQLLEGAISSITTVNLWGALGRERSRSLIIGTSTFLLAVYCSGLTWVLFQPDLNSVIPVWWQDHLDQIWWAQWRSRLSLGAVFFLTCGCLSFPLLVSQVLSPVQVDREGPAFTVTGWTPSCKCGKSAGAICCQPSDTGTETNGGPSDL